MGHRDQRRRMAWSALESRRKQKVGRSTMIDGSGKSPTFCFPLQRYDHDGGSHSVTHGTSSTRGVDFISTVTVEDAQKLTRR